MNKTLFTFIAIITVSISTIFAQNREYTTDSLSMYPGYSNDIFYSMSAGEVANVPRAGWDLGFYTAPFSAGIIINEGSGVKLYSYPNGDTSAWASVDTTGLSSWTNISNSPEYWEDGAFNVNALGHPDYGWGVYNMVTHSVIGDSLYIIEIPGTGFKKLWIVNKISVENTYNIRYADIDGSNEQNIAIDVKPFVAKNFIYYSMITNTVIDREPAASWDILFTKYIDFTEDMSGNMAEYLVTGVTSNINNFANKFTEVGVDFNDWSSTSMDSLKNTIGYDWKSFDMGTFSWTVDDSTAFFIKDGEGDIYKLIFTYWAGSGSGNLALNKEVVSLSSVGDIVENNEIISLYPNPANEVLNISLGEEQFDGQVIISDVSGRKVYGSDFNGKISVNVSNLTNGIYFVTIHNDNFKETQKLIIK